MKVEILSIISILLGMVVCVIGSINLRNGAKTIRKIEEIEKEIEEGEKILEEGEIKLQKLIEKNEKELIELEEKLDAAALSTNKNFNDARAQVENYSKEVKEVTSELKEENERFVFEPYYIYVPSGAQVVSDLGIEIREDSFYLVIYEKDGKGELFNGQGWIDLDKVYKNPQIVLPIPYTFTKETEIKNGPSKGYHTISTMKKGQNIEIIGYFGNWAKVKMANGDVGYFYTDN